MGKRGRVPDSLESGAVFIL
ncbi:hypothetical protein Ocin01_16422 [Orchesella cincta]|uniref:Uncharacterized protein n=1 Tax=Orchesella cincta TaxID=48709 RepID=A0A1D2MBB2_ORCCI|nr:hypothetical protein Ocin01_16422 [Orchesella cincta]